MTTMHIAAPISHNACSSLKRKLLHGVWIASLAGAITGYFIAPANAALFGLIGDDKTEQQAATLGPKRLPERNAGDRTSGDALMLEPASSDPSVNASMQKMPTNNGPLINGVPVNDAGGMSANMMPDAPMPSYPQAPMAESAAPMEPAYPNGAMAANGTTSTQNDSVQSGSFSANGQGLAPVRATSPAAAASGEPKKSKSLMDWMGLAEDAPAPANAQQAPTTSGQPQQNSGVQVQMQQDAAAMQPPAPQADNSGAVEYYDANGFPILAATPANPPAPNRPALAANLKDMRADNQAAEGTREAFMQRGEDAFAPSQATASQSAYNPPLAPNPNEAPSAMDELALSGSATPAPAPQPAPAPVAQAAPAPASAPMAEAPLYEPQSAPAPQSGSYAMNPPPAPMEQPAPSPAMARNEDFLPPPASPNEAPTPMAQEPMAPAPMAPAPMALASDAPPPMHPMAPMEQAPMPQAPMAEAPQAPLQPAHASAAFAPEPAPQPEFAAQPVAQPAPMMAQQAPAMASTNVPASPGVAANDEYAQGSFGTNPTLDPTRTPVSGEAAVGGTKPTVRYLPESRYAARRLASSRPSATN